MTILNTHLHIHQIVDTDTAQLWKLLPALLQKCSDSVAFLTLGWEEHAPCMYLRGQARHERQAPSKTYHDTLPMSAAVPVRVRDLNVFFLELFLLPEPFLAQLLPLPAFRFLTLAVWQERRVNFWVLPRLRPLDRRLVAVQRWRDALIAFFVIQSEGQGRLSRLLALFHFLLIPKQTLHGRLAI